MKNNAISIGTIEFEDLENRFGFDNARLILRTLEQFEGIPEHRGSELSYEDRLDYVMMTMKDNLRYQTRH